MRRAVLPSASLEIPMILPGILRLRSSFTAKYPGWGPPAPIGRPNRWTLPTAMSAPISPADFTMQRDKISEFKIDRTPASLNLVKNSVKLVRLPILSGFCTKTPQNWSAYYQGKFAIFPTTSSIPFPKQRVRITSRFWGKIDSEMKHLLRLGFAAAAYASDTASEQLVASSSSEAFEISMPVSSQIIVW